MITRSKYWSLSKAGEKIRRVFGLPKTPTALSMEDWDKFHKEERAASPIGVKVVGALDTIQDIVMWVPDKIRDIAYYTSNVKNGSHALRTQTKIGAWGDLTSRVPDALMLAVVDFVEKEAFHMNIIFDSDSTDPLVIKYRDQSYFMRKLFPIETSTEFRVKNAYEWFDYQTNFQRTGGELQVSPNASTPLEEMPYNKIKSVYEFAKTRYMTFDAFDEAGYEENMAAERSRQVFDKVRELEAAHEAEVTKHLITIVTLRDYLWT